MSLCGGCFQPNSRGVYQVRPVYVQRCSVNVHSSQFTISFKSSQPGLHAHTQFHEIVANEENSRCFLNTREILKTSTFCSYTSPMGHKNGSLFLIQLCWYSHWQRSPSKKYKTIWTDMFLARNIQLPSSTKNVWIRVKKVGTNQLEINPGEILWNILFFLENLNNSNTLNIVSICLFSVFRYNFRLAGIFLLSRTLTKTPFIWNFGFRVTNLNHLRTINIKVRSKVEYCCLPAKIGEFKKFRMPRMVPQSTLRISPWALTVLFSDRERERDKW